MVFIVLVQMHFIQRKKFSEINVTFHAFQQISDLKIIPECVWCPQTTENAVAGHMQPAGL